MARRVGLLTMMMMMGMLLGFSVHSNANVVANRACHQACYNEFGVESSNTEKCINYCNCVHLSGNGNLYCAIKGSIGEVSQSITELDHTPGSEVYDTDGDGRANASIDYFLDENDNSQRWELDSDGDGKKNSTYTSRFDHSTNTFSQELDLDGDGISDMILVNTYNKRGHRIRREIDTDGNGIIDQLQTTEYSNGYASNRGQFYDLQEDEAIAEANIFINFISRIKIKRRR